MILTGQINGMEIMLMVKLKKDVLRGGNMYSGWEQKTRTDLNAGLKEFESTHGRTPSRTPAPRYNPDKAMKEAEKQYLISKGTDKKTLMQKLRKLLENKG